MVGPHHSETLEILGEKAPLWWMTMIRMCKTTGFPGTFARSKKRGVYPPLENAKRPTKPHLTMVFDP